MDTQNYRLYQKDERGKIIATVKDKTELRHRSTLKVPGLRIASCLQLQNLGRSMESKTPDRYYIADVIN